MTLKYGDLVKENRYGEEHTYTAKRTHDHRFLVSINKNSTVSIFPLVNVKSYRIVLESVFSSLTQIVVEGKTTKVMPNYEIGREGVTMRILLNSPADYLRDLPATPTFTVTLKDAVDMRRFDFRNGKDSDDHWVAILSLTLKQSRLHRQNIERIIRVGYNGHFASDWLLQAVRSGITTVSKGFVPPPRAHEDPVDLETNSEADDEDREEYVRQSREIRSESAPLDDRKALIKPTAIRNWLQMHPSTRVDTSNTKFTAEKLEKAIKASKNIDPVRNTAPIYMEIKERSEKPLENHDRVATASRTVEAFRSTDIPELVSPRSNQHEPQKFSRKPLTMSPSPSKSSRMTRSGNITSDESGETASVSKRKSGEKKKKKGKGKSNKVILEAMQALTQTMAHLATNDDSDSSSGTN